MPGLCCPPQGARPHITRVSLRLETLLLPEAESVVSQRRVPVYLETCFILGFICWWFSHDHEPGVTVSPPGSLSEVASLACFRLFCVLL